MSGQTCFKGLAAVVLIVVTFIRFDPDVRKLVIGIPQVYYDQAEEDIRRAGCTEEIIRRAHTIKKGLSISEFYERLAVGARDYYKTF